MEAKKIIITGGATRIGAAIAESLASHGVKITLHYNKSEKEVKKLRTKIENSGCEVFLIKADMSKTSQTKKIIPFAYKKMKGLDCLINNASIFEKDDLSTFNDKSFNNHININLKAPAVLTQGFKKYLKLKKGVIINIIDQRVFKLTPFFFSYTLSKTGLQTLTKTSAMSLAPNIRVNGIAPGPTIKNKRQTEKHFKKQWRSLILKNKVNPKNICETVKYFIINDNVTGQILSVDSGQSLAWETPDIINTKEWKKKNLKIVKLRSKKNYTYKRKIIISDLTLLLSIGIHKFEKIKKQEVKFNIGIDINPSLIPIETKLNSIVNYETVIKIITELTKNKHYELLETLAEDIFNELFININILRVKIKIEKTQIIKNTLSVGIEISKKRLW